MPSPPPTSRIGASRGRSTSATSASATNGSTRNDCPSARDGRTPSAASVSATAPGDSGAPAPGAARDRSRRDEEAVLVRDTLELGLDPTDEEHLRALQVEPRLQVGERGERPALPLLHDRLHRPLADPGQELEQVEPSGDGRG